MIGGGNECLWGGYGVFEVGLSKIKQVGNGKSNGVKNKRPFFFFLHFFTFGLLLILTRIIIIGSYFTSSDHL